MDDFDLTQPMSLCYDDDDPIAETNEVAILGVPLQDGFPKELEFSLYNGVNRIGRSESCEVCIKNKVLSKEHAVIEVGGDCFLIYDLNSSNKTWRGKKPLKPNVKYKLEPNDEVRFGNIKTQFTVKKNEVHEGGDSGSETGSESMLLLNEEYCAFSMSTPIKNVSAKEGGNDISGNASTSSALFSKNLSSVEAKTESPKDVPLDLENAPTQEFNRSNFSDSGDETDCEDHSIEKTVTREKVVVNLGGKVVEDVNLCTHLVADKLRRTVKALCCIAKGIPLVNTKWIQECQKMESFVDHAPYLIKDTAAEKQYKFQLQNTLQKATEKPLLSSWSIHVTPKVVPSPEQMKDIIQCAGGKYLPKMPNRLSEKTVVISCAPDLNLCSHATKCGIPLVGSEFILTGLLQYKIDTKSYKLSKK